MMPLSRLEKALRVGMIVLLVVFVTAQIVKADVFRSMDCTIRESVAHTVILARRQGMTREEAAGYVTGDNFDLVDQAYAVWFWPWHSDADRARITLDFVDRIKRECRRV